MSGKRSRVTVFGFCLAGKVQPFVRSALPRFNEEICKKHFEELGVSELSNIFVKGSRKKYAKSKIAANLLSIFKEHGWIYDFFEDDKNSENYFVIKNRPRERAD